MSHSVILSWGLENLVSVDLVTASGILCKMLKAFEKCSSIHLYSPVVTCMMIMIPLYF